jgi:hypothetical protein
VIFGLVFIPGQSAKTTPRLESCHSGLALLPGMTVPGAGAPKKSTK